MTMNPNPLSSLEEQLKQQSLNSRLDAISNDVKFIKGACLVPKFIEVNILTDTGVDSITINPDSIVYMESVADNTLIHLSNSTIVQSNQSKDEILSLIFGVDKSSNTYIK